MALRLGATVNRHLFTNLKRHLASKANINSNKLCEIDLYAQNVRNDLQPKNLKSIRDSSLMESTYERKDAEHKMHSKYSKGTPRKNVFLSNLNFSRQTGSYRSFSYDMESDACRTKKPDEKKKCKKFDLCDCEQAKDMSCVKMAVMKECKKREAPYPSFSEACYEEPYNKPSECKMCPWKPWENPNPTFKHKNPRGYHTAANAAGMNQNFKPYKKSSLLEKKPLERVLTRMLSDAAAYKQTPLETPAKEAEGRAGEITGREMSGNSAGKTVGVSLGRDHSNCDELNCNCGLCSRKVTRVTFGGARADTAPPIGEMPFIHLPNFYEFAAPKNTNSGRPKPCCIKFPFKPCNFDRGAAETSKPKPMKCPKLPHRFHRKVVDCPAEPGDKKTCMGYLMADKDGCPKVDKSKCEGVFPFKPCNFDRGAAEKSKPKPMKCPKLPHRFHRKVVDCPAEPGEKKSCLGYLMADNKPGCPQVDKTKCGGEHKVKCPKKEIRSQICPSEPLVKKRGYQPQKKSNDPTKKTMTILQDVPMMLLAQEAENAAEPSVRPTAQAETRRHL